MTSTTSAQARPHEINVPYIICKPKIVQDCSITKSDIQNKVNIGRRSIGVESMKNRKDGSVFIKCNTNKSREQLKCALVESMGEGYEVDETRMRQPAVFIGNLDENIDSESLIDSIKSQNDFITEEDQMQLSLLRKNRRKNGQFAIIQCNRSAFNKLIKAGRVYVGLRRCPLHENLSVLRCYKCYKFNHKGKDCKYVGDKRCSKCAGTHRHDECSSNLTKCMNCLDSNEKYGTRYSVDHEVLDVNCPLHKIQLDRQKERTDYNITQLIFK